MLTTFIVCPGRAQFIDFLCGYLAITRFILKLMHSGKCPVNMPELGQSWADATRIGPEPAQFWHITACLQGDAPHNHVLVPSPNPFIPTNFK